MTFHTKGDSVKRAGQSGNGKHLPVDKVNLWEYSASPENKDHISIKRKYDLFINGSWVKSKKYFDTINPANEEKIAEAAHASGSDVDRAVDAADKAYRNVWRKISPREKAKYIFRIARIMQEKPVSWQ